MLLQDKVAVITGAANGIGEEIARTFLREGARVVVADLCGETATEATRELDPSGERALAVAMDVTDEAQVENGMERAIATFGSIDILVSNAGIQHLDLLHEVEFSQWKRMLAVHLDGAFLTTRAALRHMYAKGDGGSILYIGSVHSKEASPFKVPYVVAKHGLIGLAKGVAKEGAEHGVRANVVCPGFVRTPLVEQQISRLAKEYGIAEEEVAREVMLKETVDGEFTTTRDVAEACLFFAAYASNALTGQSLVVSHGWHMQ